MQEDMVGEGLGGMTPEAALLLSILYKVSGLGTRHESIVVELLLHALQVIIGQLPEPCADGLDGLSGAVT